MASIDEIRSKAEEFRNAVQNNVGNLHSISLKKFPMGSCGDVSDMLGKYFLETIQVNCQYVSGWDREGTQSHAWLELDDVVIDITGDQFAGNESVIVSKGSEFHRRFVVDLRRPSGIGGSPISVDLSRDYELVVDTIRRQRKTESRWKDAKPR